MRRTVAGSLAVLAIGLSACGGSSVAAAHNQRPTTTTTTQPVATTTTVPPTTITVPPTTTTAPAPTTTTTAAPTGYVSLDGAESYLNTVSSQYQSDTLNFTYSNSNGDYEATTDDGVCTFTLTNSLGESSSLVDGITISCGPPSTSSAFTHAEALESATFLVGAATQFAGQAAGDWVAQKTTAASDAGTGVNAQQAFGPMTVGLVFGGGALQENFDAAGN